MSFENSKGNGYSLNLDLVIILLQVYSEKSLFRPDYLRDGLALEETILRHLSWEMWVLLMILSEMICFSLVDTSAL